MSCLPYIRLVLSRSPFLFANRQTLANIWLNGARLEPIEKDLPQAQQCLAESLRFLQPIIKENSNDASLLTVMASAQAAAAELLLTQGKRKEGLKELRSSQALYARLLKIAPNHEEWRKEKDHVDTLLNQ